MRAEAKREAKTAGKMAGRTAGGIAELAQWERGPAKGLIALIAGGKLKRDAKMAGKTAVSW